MLAPMALNSAINRLFRCLPVRHREERRRLARSASSTPVDHVAVMPAICVQRQHVVCEESPALRVSRHLSSVSASLFFSACQEDGAAASSLLQPSPLKRHERSATCCSALQTPSKEGLNDRRAESRSALGSTSRTEKPSLRLREWGLFTPLLAALSSTLKGRTSWDSAF